MLNRLQISYHIPGGVTLVTNGYASEFPGMKKHPFLVFLSPVGDIGILSIHASICMHFRPSVHHQISEMGTDLCEVLEYCYIVCFIKQSCDVKYDTLFDSMENVHNYT